MTKVGWTDAALTHLRGIRDYIAADSPGYARRLVERVIGRTEQLAAFPFSGGKVLEYDDPMVRELLERPYRIIYRVRAERVDILAVVHSARLLPDDLQSRG
jgi:toxin ParE1/3/4